MSAKPSDLFTSASRTKLLLALYEFHAPVSLHELAEIVGSSVCAAQNALKQLLSERLVLKKVVGNETQYTLNRKKKSIEFIRVLALAKERVFLNERAKTYGKQAAGSLRFSNDTLLFLSKVRSLNAKS